MLCCAINVSFFAEFFNCFMQIFQIVCVQRMYKNIYSVIKVRMCMHAMFPDAHV